MRLGYSERSHKNLRLGLSRSRLCHQPREGIQAVAKSFRWITTWNNLIG